MQVSGMRSYYMYIFWRTRTSSVFSLELYFEEFWLFVPSQGCDFLPEYCMCSLNSGNKLTCSHPIIGEPKHSKGDSVQKVDPSKRCCWRYSSPIRMV